MISLEYVFIFFVKFRHIICRRRYILPKMVFVQQQPLRRHENLVVTLAPPHSKAEEDQPQRTGHCGWWWRRWRWLSLDWQVWLDISEDPGHEYRWAAVCEVHCVAETVNLAEKTTKASLQCETLMTRWSHTWTTHDKYQMHVYSPYQIFADFDWILEHGPDDSLVAIWGGQGAEVSVVLGEVHPDQKRIQWNSTNIDLIGWRRRKKSLHFILYTQLNISCEACSYLRLEC